MKNNVERLKARLYNANSQVYEAQRKFERAMVSYFKRLSVVYHKNDEWARDFDGGEVPQYWLERIFMLGHDFYLHFGVVRAWSGEPIKIRVRASKWRGTFWRRARGGWRGKVTLTPDIDARADLNKIEARLDKYSAARESAERKRAVLIEELKAVGCDYGEYKPIFHA